MFISATAQVQGEAYCITATTDGLPLLPGVLSATYLIDVSYLLNME